MTDLRYVHVRNFVSLHMDIVLKPFVGGFVFKSVVTDHEAVEMIQRYWFTIFCFFLAISSG